MNLPGINSVFFNMSSLEKLKNLGCFDKNNIYTLLNAASTVIDLAAVIFNNSVVDVLVNTNSTYIFTLMYLYNNNAVANFVELLTKLLICH